MLPSVRSAGYPTRVAGWKPAAAQCRPSGTTRGLIVHAPHNGGNRDSPMIVTLPRISASRVPQSASNTATHALWGRRRRGPRGIVLAENQGRLRRARRRRHVHVRADLCKSVHVRAATCRERRDQRPPQHRHGRECQTYGRWVGWLGTRSPPAGGHHVPARPPESYVEQTIQSVRRSEGPTRRGRSTGVCPPSADAQTG